MKNTVASILVVLLLSGCVKNLTVSISLITVNPNLLN